MNISTINQSQQTFCKYVKPDEGTRKVIDEYFKNVPDAKEQKDRANVYAKLVIAQNENRYTKTYIKKDESDFTQNGLPNLIVDVKDFKGNSIYKDKAKDSWSLLATMVTAHNVANKQNAQTQQEQINKKAEKSAQIADVMEQINSVWNA